MTTPTVDASQTTTTAQTSQTTPTTDVSLTTPTASDFAACPGVAEKYIRIALRYPGVYRISGEELTSAGANLDEMPIANLALWNEGRMLPLNINAEPGEIKLSPNDTIEFVGDSPRGTFSAYKPYNTQNIYYLNWTTTQPLHYRKLLVEPSTTMIRNGVYREQKHLEEDKIFWRTSLPPGITDGFFMCLYDTGPIEQFKIEFPGFVQSLNQPIDLKFRFFGITNVTNVKPSHKFDIMYAKNKLGTIAFDGIGYCDFTTTIPPQLVKENRTLYFVPPPDRVNIVDKMALDSIDIGYPRSLDANQRALFQFNNRLVGVALPCDAVLSDTLPNTRVFSGADSVLYTQSPGKTSATIVSMEKRPTTYTAVADTGIYQPDQIEFRQRPVNITDPPPDTEALVLYHPDVRSPALCYAKYRNQNGLPTFAVDVSRIFDALNNGFISDVVLKRYIRYVADSAPMLKYLVLFGDSTADYREVNYREILGEGDGRAYKILIPIHWVYNPQTTYSSGYPDDNWYGAFGTSNHPDIAVGRISVNNDEEGYEYFRKVVEYEQLMCSRDDKALLVSSVEARFQEIVNETAKQIGEKFSTVTLLFPETRIADREVLRLRDEINSGVQIIYYVGHGGSFVWRVGPIDFKLQKDLFTPADVAKLNNSQHYPIITCSSCYITSFDNEFSLGEAFLIKPHGGAIAVIGTPWKSAIYDDHEFNRHFFNLYINPSTERLGDAFYGAKKALRPANHEQADFQTFTLLGDPCLMLVHAE
ncbi:MAG: C25 family cysteine peptidase [bacterium]